MLKIADWLHQGLKAAILGQKLQSFCLYWLQEGRRSD